LSRETRDFIDLDDEQLDRLYRDQLDELLLDETEDDEEDDWTLIDENGRWDTA
jgi:hypothetical protein